MAPFSSTTPLKSVVERSSMTLSMHFCKSCVKLHAQRRTHQLIIRAVVRVFVETQRRDAYYRNDPSKYGLEMRGENLVSYGRQECGPCGAHLLCLIFVFVMRNSANFDFERRGSVDRVPVVSKKIFRTNSTFCTSNRILTPQVTFERLSTYFQLSLTNASFAQWHYHSLWSSTETWWLLIENFSQYPARRREIPTAMQCLEDLLRSTINNESV